MRSSSPGGTCRACGSRRINDGTSPANRFPCSTAWSSRTSIGTALTSVYAIVIAPIGEELFFRGVLFRSLRDRHGFWVGAMGSAVGFALIHYIPGSAVDAALLMIVMFFTGLALCFLYERRGTIVAPLAAHMMFNVIGILLILGLR